MKKKVTLLNMISGLMLQVCTLISGFILPKIILGYFGSDVNGLVSSLNQFLSYITLVEGGITGVIIANLYKPLVEKDDAKLFSIMVTSKTFFNKIGLFFIVYTIGLSIIYPLVFKTKFSFGYVCSLTLILSMTLLIQYMFSINLKTLLNADKKGYIVSFSQMLIVVLNVILAYISVKVYPSIHLLKMISGSLFILQPIIYGRYIRKNYNIDWKSKADNSLIKTRWNGFAINFAAFIHNSTDISILTIFTDLATVSVYSVYALVSNGIKQLINACLTGVAHTVGHAYARGDFKELHKKMDIYEYLVFMLVFFMYSVSVLLITPFVMLYTKNITDANYCQPVFGILLLISEALYLVKLPHLNLAYSANKFKEITAPAFVEALLNIVVSVLLVRKFGLIGVTIGTILGMTYRMVFHVYYTKKLVQDRHQMIFYRKLFVFLVTSIIGILICTFIAPVSLNCGIVEWIKSAVVYSGIIGCLLMAISIVFFKTELRFFISYIRK